MNVLRIALGWSGRIDRTTFLAAFGMLWLASSVGSAAFGMSAMLSPNATLLSFPFLGAMFWSTFAIQAKRLRDMGRSPALAFLPLLLAGVMLMGFPAVTGGWGHSVDARFLTLLIGWGFALLGAGVVGAAMLVWLALARSHPGASGEDLSFASQRMGAPAPAGVPDARESASRALERALERMANGASDGPPEGPRGGFGRR